MIRGGYGVSSFFEGYSFNQRLTSSPPFSLAINSNAVTPSATSGGTPFTVADAFSQPLGINNSLYSVWPQNTQPANIQQYNLTTEYAITNDLSLSVGYHGQNGDHLADYRNGNQLTLAAGARCLQPRLRLRHSPWPISRPTILWSVNAGLFWSPSPRHSMNYNSGQVSLRQRTHHGLEYTLNYTYAKSLTNSSGNYAVGDCQIRVGTARHSKMLTT